MIVLGSLVVLAMLVVVLAPAPRRGARGAAAPPAGRARPFAVDVLIVLAAVAGGAAAAVNLGPEGNTAGAVLAVCAGLVPTVLLFSPPRERARLRVLVAAGLAALTLFGGFEVGIFFMPAAVVAVIAVLGARLRGERASRRPRRA